MPNAVIVRLAPPTPEAQGWTNVTPGGMNLTSFGVQAVIQDPVRLTDWWTTADADGVWKSTDYGKTWVRLTTFAPRWTLAINPNLSRSPSAIPKLWTSYDFGLGVGISTDGGVNWSSVLTNNSVAAASGGDASWGNDVYQVVVDPTDENHLLATFHGNPGISESFNGGANWSTVTGTTSTQGISLYVFFIQPSPAEVSGGATISTTWMCMTQWGDGGGLSRTTNSGATWTKVDSLEHAHGNAQIFSKGNGEVYAAGLDGSAGNGIYKSTNYGQSFTRVYGTNVQNGVFATRDNLYADYGWATSGTQTQVLVRSPYSDGGTWTNYVATPGGMTNGSVQAKTGINNADQDIIVAGMRLAGLWRYVE